jgi:dTDP-4-dehydrorhamnose reductase
MKVLITGANGFLGQHLCRLLRNSHTVFATGKGNKRIPFEDVNYHPAEITDSNSIEELLKKTAPQVIIHAAAMSKPDECDVDRELCDAINITATRHLINASGKLELKPHFIYVSTDFVFGEGGPHDEEAIPSPLNYYGESKLKAEKIVEQSGLLYSIVRPVFMYGETWEGIRPTFLGWVKQSLEEGKQIKVVSDQVRTPTYVGDICKGIATVVEQKATGLYHLAGEERLSPYDMAVRFAKFSGLNENLVEPVTGETFKEPVQRAKQGGLKIGKAKQQLGFVALSFQQGLQQMFSRV